MISLYTPGRSILHRTPAVAKLSGLLLLALAISLAPRDALSTVFSGSVVVVLYACAGMFPVGLLVQLWRLKWMLLFLVVTQLLFLPPQTVALNSGRVVTLVLLAGLLALTTRAEDLLAALDGLLAPLAKVGVDVARLSLTLSLTVAALPVVAEFARRVREAQRARGARLGARVVVPLLVMSLRHADDVGDALAARGIAT